MNNKNLIGREAQIYYNLNKGGWSIRTKEISPNGKKTWKVTGHIYDGLIVKVKKLTVQEGTRQRIIEKKQKSVCAFLTGEIVSIGGKRPKLKNEYSFNPYYKGYFYETKTKKRVDAENLDNVYFCNESRKFYALPK
jgi:hypothetical protein